MVLLCTINLDTGGMMQTEQILDFNLWLRDVF